MANQQAIDELREDLVSAKPAVEPLEKACEAGLQADMADLQKFGVGATPTFFINGRVLIGAQPIESFAALIDEELREGKPADRRGLATGHVLPGLGARQRAPEARRAVAKRATLGLHSVSRDATNWLHDRQDRKTSVPARDPRESLARDQRRHAIRRLVRREARRRVRRGPADPAATPTHKATSTSRFRARGRRDRARALLRVSLASGRDRSEGRLLQASRPRSSSSSSPTPTAAVSCRSARAASTRFQKRGAPTCSGSTRTGWNEQAGEHREVSCEHVTRSSRQRRCSPRSAIRRGWPSCCACAPMDHSRSHSSATALT